MSYNKLSPEEKYVIVNKGTERPFSGKYVQNKEKGIYSCKRCGAPLYKSSDKFDSGCGWPSFDDEIVGAVKKSIDADGLRTEILCASCGGHLGHLFIGENLTEKNTRHCVNSISMNFTPEKKIETAVFAGGCFWGVEHYYLKLKGVLSTSVGYTGGKIDNPTYRQVCTGTTGHIEALKVEFDPKLVTFEELAKLFFEIHDPTQIGRQGPDIGEQYSSVIFYQNEKQKEISKKLIKVLEGKGYKIATELRKAKKFWDAEEYHQEYYNKNGKQPYCHIYTKRF